MKRKSVAALLTVALLAASAPAAALDGPEETVRRLYRQGQPDTVQEADRWLARDVARRYKVDLIADEPKPSTDFDWRYGTQEYSPTELTFARAVDLPPVDGVVMREVAVSFRNFGEGPHTVTWTLCLGRSGWKVADVRSDYSGGPWSLREMLELPNDTIKC